MIPRPSWAGNLQKRGSKGAKLSRIALIRRNLPGRAIDRQDFQRGSTVGIDRIRGQHARVCCKGGVDPRVHHPPARHPSPTNASQLAPRLV
jgi:hypothetical protein